MKRSSFLLAIIISMLVKASPCFSQQIMEMDEEKYIAKKFDTLSLFDHHLKLFRNENILICHQSEMNQDGGRFFKTVFKQFDYINPTESQKLNLPDDIGLPVSIEYFFILKKSDETYAKIKYIQENGKALKWIVNIRDALDYDEIQIPNSTLINQYALYKEFLNSKPTIDERDVENYINLFDPINTEGKNEFQIKRLTDAAMMKCDSLKALTIIGYEYFEFNRTSFDKYDFERKGIEINIKTQFEYRLQPQLNRASSLMGYDKTPNTAIISFVNLKKKKTQKELEDLSAAFKMGLITMDEFNSRMSEENSSLFLDINPDEAEKVITRIDSLMNGRQFYTIYNFKVINASYSTYAVGIGRQLNVDAILSSIVLYLDANRTILFRTITVPNQNTIDTNLNTEEINNDNISEKVDIEADFPGGDASWRRFLERNLNANIASQNKAPVGTYSVWVQFAVDKDGTVTDVKALTHIGYGTEEEAVNLIKKGPNWTPAIKDGRQVKSNRKVQITFLSQ